MKKTPTLFLRDDADRRHVTDTVNPDCQWVLDGEGVATRKYDGVCTMLDADGRWWARREVKPGKTPPPNYQAVETDEVTGKTVGWEPLEQSGFARFHAEALEPLTQFGSLTGRDMPAGTYELVGPKINGNPEKAAHHRLESHANAERIDWADSRTDITMFESLRSCMAWLASDGVEGIVWHHPDGRMAKLKVRDFPPAPPALQDFYVTFGSQYPREPHPTWQYAHADGWVRVQAPTYDLARSAVVNWLAGRWSMLYPADEWEPMTFFPRGELAVVVVDADGRYLIDETRASAIVEEERALLAAAEETRRW